MQFKEFYFHAIAICIGVGFLSGVAHAEVVNDHYKSVVKKSPYSIEICEDVVVGGDKTGDALTGAIIGGVIGNNVTKNVENGGAVGALLGGIIGHNNSKAQSRVETQCRRETRYNETVEEVYSHSTVTFYHNGKKYSLRFQK
jgi:uncharacterized protein YcfJ